ncbi:MAG: AAA family ATPase, partial [Myxococcota bacterium]
MEAAPKMSPESLAQLAFSPYVELRRLKTEVTIGQGRQQTTWKGRLPVIVDRWPKEEFAVAILPTLNGQRFAVRQIAALPAATARYLGTWASKKIAATDLLNMAVCQTQEYLELLTVDIDLPSILPSRPRKSRRRPRKKASAKKTANKPNKRKLIPPRTLNTVADNLTHRALDDRIDRAFYRDAIVEELLRQLDRPGACVLLVGPTGVGKTAIVHEVVHRWVSASTALTDRHDVWRVDANRLIAGMSVVGAWEHRVTEMVNELSARQDLLFVNDLPALVYTGRSAHSDTNVADFLEPHLGRGEIRILAECTPERLAVLQDEAPGFFARFRVLQIPEMSENDALHVLLRVVRRLDADGALAVAPAALETTVALTRRFRALEVHPGKAVDLLTRAIADRTDIERDDFGRRVVDEDAIIQHFARQAGLPDYLLLGRGGPTPKQIYSFFARRIVGQPEAVEAAVDV